MSEPQIVPIRATLVSGGLAAIAAEMTVGERGRISAIALGTGGSIINGQPRGYSPGGDETALRSEVVRMPIAAAQQVGPREWMAEASAPPLAAGQVQWITEAAAYLADGTLLGIWSRPTGPLFARTDLTVSLIGFTLAFDELPANAVEFVAVGTPSINLQLLSFVLQSAASILELQRRSFENISIQHQAGWTAAVNAA